MSDYMRDPIPELEPDFEAEEWVEPIRFTPWSAVSDRLDPTTRAQLIRIITRNRPSAPVPELEELLSAPSVFDVTERLDRNEE